MTKMLTFLITLFFVLVAGILWMAAGLQKPGWQKVAVEKTRHPAGKFNGTLRVLVWNIAWGYGTGSEGTGKAKPRPHFEKRIREIAEFVRDQNPDIALIQEIDFDATRSHRLDQAAQIAEIAEFHNYATAVSWRANWVPFPYWPPSEHFGFMRSGGAIFSRFPLQESSVTLLPKPESQPFWYNLFYLFRYLHLAEITLGEHPTLKIANVHFEAFDQVNRTQHAKETQAIVQPYSASLILGGDFNTVPLAAKRKTNYPDEPATDHKSDQTYGIVAEIPELRDAFRESNEDFTFPASKPNRKLDHFFASKQFQITSAKALSNAKQLSDHLPLLVQLAILE